jgi:uncharacterized protein YjiS (DUF1127 family)
MISRTFVPSHRTATPIGSLLTTLVQRLAAFARRQWRAYWDYRARSATLMMLQAMDDRALKDIGLTRSQIWTVAFGKGARDRAEG